jgi:uncharacterized membrane protein YhaH (DUF805 family)
MSKLQQMFSFNGRTSRLGYWRTQITLLLAAALFWCGGFLLADVTGVGAWSAIALGGAILIYLPVIALLFRRLHDRNKSGWWLLALYLAPFAISVALNAEPNLGEVATLVLSLIGLALWLWGFVEIGLRRGTPGPNRYGPDPQAA